MNELPHLSPDQRISVSASSEQTTIAFTNEIQTHLPNITDTYSTTTEIGIWICTTYRFQKKFKLTTIVSY